MDAIQKLKERQERETRRLFEAQQAQLTQLNKLHLLRNNTNNPSPAAATATASIPDLDLPSSSGTGVTAAATSSSPARSTSGRSNREAWPGPAARNTKVATTSSSSAATPSAFSEASAAGTKHSPGRKIGRAKNADDQVVGSASRLSSPTNPSYDDDDEREIPKVDFNVMVEEALRREASKSPAAMPSPTPSPVPFISSRDTTGKPKRAFLKRGQGRGGGGGPTIQTQSAGAPSGSTSKGKKPTAAAPASSASKASKSSSSSSSSGGGGGSGSAGNSRRSGLPQRTGGSTPSSSLSKRNGGGGGESPYGSSRSVGSNRGAAGSTSSSKSTVGELLRNSAGALLGKASPSYHEDEGDTEGGGSGGEGHNISDVIERSFEGTYDLTPSKPQPRSRIQGHRLGAGRSGISRGGGGGGGGHSDNDVGSESSFLLSRSQWERNQEDAERELEEFQLLEMETTYPRPARVRAGVQGRGRGDSGKAQYTHFEEEYDGAGSGPLTPMPEDASHSHSDVGRANFIDLDAKSDGGDFFDDHESWGDDADLDPESGAGAAGDWGYNLGQRSAVANHPREMKQSREMKRNGARVSARSSGNYRDGDDGDANVNDGGEYSDSNSDSDIDDGGETPQPAWGEDEDNSGVSDDGMRGRSPPPQSKLVASLFSKDGGRGRRERDAWGKRRKQPPTGPFEPSRSEDRREDGDRRSKSVHSSSLDQIADPVVADAIRTKLAELDVQIAHFKDENASVAKMQQQCLEESNASKAAASKEAQDLDKREAEFQEYKREQSAKLKRERSVFETHKSEARSGPSKQEREQIDALQTELDDLHQQMSDQKQRSSLAAGRYRDTIATVTRRNAELEEEVRLLEEMRLNAWSNKPSYSRGGAGGSGVVADGGAQHREHRPPMPAEQHPAAPEPKRGAAEDAADFRPYDHGHGHGHEQEQASLSNGYPGPPRPLHGYSSAGSGGGAPLSSSDAAPMPPSARNTQGNSDGVGSHTGNDDGGGVPNVYTKDAVKRSENPFAHGRDSLAAGYTPSTGHALDINLGARSNSDSGRPPRDGVLKGGSQAKRQTAAQVAASVDPAREAGSVRFEEWEDEPAAERASSTGGHRVQTIPISQSEHAHASADDAAAAAAAAGDIEGGLEGVPVTSRHPDGKVEKVFPNGAKVVTFPNGTNKEFFTDGHAVVRFFNGDLKQTYGSGQVVYFYAESKTTHTTYPDGLELLEFANGQTEKNYPDGTQEIGFPDKTSKFIYANGEEETVFPDGTVQRLTANGERAIDYPNGQQEVHTANYKKRRYPDGTVKIVYPDGRQETKYANGRVRVKDKDGYVIVDTTLSQSQQQQPVQQQQQQHQMPMQQQQQQQQHQQQLPPPHHHPHHRSNPQSDPSTMQYVV